MTHRRQLVVGAATLALTIMGCSSTVVVHANPAATPIVQQTCKALSSWRDDLTSLARSGAQSISTASSDLQAEKEAVADLVWTVRTRTTQLRASLDDLGRTYRQVPGAASVEGALVKEFDRADATFDTALTAAMTMPTDTRAHFDAAKTKIARTVSAAGGTGLRLSDLHLSDAAGTASFFKTLQTEPSCLLVLS